MIVHRTDRPTARVPLFLRHLPHLMAAATLLLLAACVALLYLTHFALGSIISVSALLAAVPMSLVFGLSQLLQSIVAGIIIRAERKLRVGDPAIVAGILGTVSGIHLRTTQLAGADGSIAVIPNAVILMTPFTVLPATESPPHETAPSRPLAPPPSAL